MKTVIRIIKDYDKNIVLKLPNTLV